MRAEARRVSDRKYYATVKGLMNRARKHGPVSYETRLRRLASATGHWLIIPRMWGDGKVFVYRYRYRAPSVHVDAMTMGEAEHYLSNLSGLRIRE
jgi:hypothetical protein